MSVQTTNTLSQITLLTAFESASTAAAGAIIGNPIGALGGALFGATRFITQIPLIKGAARVLNLSDPRSNTAAKTLGYVIRVLGSYAAAWGVLALAGFTLTLPHVAILAAVGIACDLALASLLHCNGIQIPDSIRV